MHNDKRASVWVDDRNEIFRRGLASCLSAAGFLVVGESANLLPRPDLRRVDVLLFDLDEAALRAALRLHQGTETRLVGIASSPSEELLFEAVEAGLAGLLLRSELTPSGLINCLGAVTSGTNALPGDLLGRLLRRLTRGPRPALAESFARRELQVLRLLGEGASTREIAADLCYSEKTVKNIVHDVLVKTNSRTRAQAVLLAARLGLI